MVSDGGRIGTAYSPPRCVVAADTAGVGRDVTAAGGGGIAGARRGSGGREAATTRMVCTVLVYVMGLAHEKPAYNSWIERAS